MKYSIKYKSCNGDIRYGYNRLEICSIVCKDNHITLDDLKRSSITTNITYDKTKIITGYFKWPTKIY
ncbi:MAG: hypothetical protein ACLTAI_04680 [Thomasclavelia sp.]